MAAIGIDLGTTNCCAAVVRNGTVRIIPNELGKHTTPSVIAFCGMKYLIGRNDKDPQVKNLLSKTTFKHIVDWTGTLKIVVNNSEFYRPEEISALLLKELKTDAEKFLDQYVDTAVITVPTYFGDKSRQATIDAGKIAGFENIHLLNEPTAAAIAYGVETDNNNKTVLVFDLGGGTFDVSILSIKDNEYFVLGIDGDLNMGGDDIDNNISKYLLEYLHDQGINTPTDKFKLYRLNQISEKAKISLSSLRETELDLVNFYADDTDADINLTRNELNEINEDLFEKAINITKSCLQKNNIKKEDIDIVLLVGGSTRIHNIRERIKSNIGKIKQNINPDEAVAMGAAIMASKLTGSDFQDLKVNQICAHSIGKDDHYDEYEVFIPKHSTIPIKVSQVWQTIPKGSRDMSIEILVGESKVPSENELIGEFKIKNIFLSPDGQRRVTISFEIDSNGILQVTADDGHGKSGNLTINLEKGNLTTGEINELASKINTKYIAFRKS